MCGASNGHAVLAKEEKECLSSALMGWLYLDISALRSFNRDQYLGTYVFMYKEYLQNQVKVFKIKKTWLLPSFCELVRGPRARIR